MKILLVYPKFPDTFWSFNYAVPGRPLSSYTVLSVRCAPGNKNAFIRIFGFKSIQLLKHRGWRLSMRPGEIKFKTEDTIGLGAI